MLKGLTPQKIIPFVISLSFFMEAVDSTIINTAIPAMAGSLRVDPVDLKVALISYLLSLAIFIPISGWLTDKFGDKRVFISALVIFTLSSIWCGFAQGITGLVMARFIQGFGGALGLPVGRLIIIRTFGRQNLITMMNRVVTVGSLGIMLGPVIGGFITHYFSWHWIFWVNIPVGIIAILLAYYCLEDTKPKSVPPLDKLGFVLFGSALAGFTFGLAALSQTTVEVFMAVSIIIVSLILLIAYIVRSRHQLHPVVNTSLFKLRTFQVSVAGNLLSRLGFGGVPFLVPLLLQIGLGYSADLSGLLLSPLAIGIVLSKTVSLPLLRLFGYKRLLLINTCLTGLSVWSLMLIGPYTSIYFIVFLIFIHGFIVTIEYSLMNSLVYAEISPDNLSAASSISSTLQQLSQSFGVAVSAIFIRLFSLIYSENLMVTVAIIHYTFFAVGLITILSAIIFLRLKGDDGQQMIL